MAMNPKQLFKMKERLSIFQSQHPKVIPFFNALKDRVQEGSVVEIKVTHPNGKEMVCNFRVTKDDMETVTILGK